MQSYCNLREVQNKSTGNISFYARCCLWNFNEPWTSTTTGGNRFTHKENMSWNLFGSPYLCAMNYSDLQYGRVLYGYEGGYKTVKTYGDDGAIVDGHIPAAAPYSLKLQR